MINYNDNWYVYYKDIIELYDSIKFENSNGIISIVKKSTLEVIESSVEYTLIKDMVFISQTYLESYLSPILNNL